MSKESFMHALIVCNGEPPDTKLLKLRVSGADLIIAADGGAQPLLKSGIQPDIIIGDMDSFVPPANHSLNIMQDDDQETNDLEKALNYALKMKIKHVLIFGATGRRTDHTLKNISVMQQFAASFDEIRMEDDYLFYRILPRHFTLDIAPGTIVSLFPVSGKVTGITTTGLKFSLLDETLENGVRDGSSNMAVSDVVTITYKSGSLLMMIEK